MAIYKVDGRVPQVGAAAFVADNATLAGDVTLAEESSVWYGAVLRADTGRITVDAGSNVQDNAVLHTGPGLDVVVGRNVSIGHSAVVHGCTVGDDCLIGMHATILNGAVIGAGSLVAAGALVTENAVIPAGSLVVGVPGKVVRTVSEKQKASIAANGEEYRQAYESIKSGRQWYMDRGAGYGMDMPTGGKFCNNLCTICALMSCCMGGMPCVCCMPSGYGRS